MNNTSKVVKFVAYTRVSTDEQGRSGLGIEAQDAAIRSAVAATDGGKIVKSFTEIASGDDDDRPELHKALDFAKRSGAVVIVSRLDRLSRAVAMVSGLIRDGYRIRFADSPNASDLEIHLRAAIAQEERRLIAQRTIDALSALRHRGIALGSARDGHWNGREHLRHAGGVKGRAIAARNRTAISDPIYAEVRDIVTANGLSGLSLRRIAAEINAMGLETPGGSTWTAASIRRALAAT
jgi:DNA invertase Pin-like site-specific DNA recombinase